MTDPVLLDPAMQDQHSFPSPMTCICKDSRMIFLSVKNAKITTRVRKGISIRITKAQDRFTASRMDWVDGVVLGFAVKNRSEVDTSPGFT